MATSQRVATHPTRPIDLTHDDEEASDELKASLKLPTQKIIAREQSLRHKQVHDLTIDDFTIGETSEGASLLVAQVVDAILTFHSDLTTFQVACLAAHAITHHPYRLLGYLKNTSAMNNFVVQALCNFLVDTSDPSTLSPSITPYLVADDTLRLKMDPDTLNDEDRKDIIYYFGLAFYPLNVNEMMNYVQIMPSDALQLLVNKKSALSNKIDRLIPGAQFTPPEWTDLSVILTHAPSSTPGSTTNSPVFDPLEHMGMPRSEFTKLPPDLMKQIAMVKLPQALATITTTPIILNILTALREAKSAQTIEFLLGDTFTHYLNNPPVNADKDATLYYYRLCLQMMRGKRCPIWRTSPEAILSHWLQAAIPVIAPLHKSMLIHPPHYNNLDQLLLTHSSPTAQIVGRYVSDVHTNRNEQITYMDFWLLTSCLDILPTLRQQELGHTKTQNYRTIFELFSWPVQFGAG